METYIAATSKWAQEMQETFDDFKYFPELEILGAGCFVFFFYDLPNGKRLGINDECIVLYTENPDCEGIWSYYFEQDQDAAGKALLSMHIFDLIATSSPLYN